MHDPKLNPDSTIAVVGASARAAAFSLLRGGYQVVAADLFADADLAKRCRADRVTPYPEGFAAWLARINCDAWLYTGALENYPQLVQRLSVSHPLIGHAGDALRRVRDPLELQRVLRENNFHFPETQPVEGGKTPATNDWLTKTYQGSCGNGVGREGNAAYIQRYIEGTPLSTVFRGCELLGITRQLVGETWAGASEFQYCGTIAPWLVPCEYEQELQRLGELLCDEFGMTELYGVDLIDDGQRVWAIEVNPRYTAAVEVIERACDFSVFGPMAPRQPNGHYGKVVLYAKAPLVVSEALTENLLQQVDSNQWPRVADIPNAGTSIETGQPVCSLFAEASSSDAVLQQLQQRIDDLEKQLYRESAPCV